MFPLNSIHLQSSFDHRKEKAAVTPGGDKLMARPLQAASDGAFASLFDIFMVIVCKI